MIHGIGTDIIEIKRIEQVIQRYGNRFLNRVFTPTEQTYCLRHKESARHFAGRFAAKEAIVKAMGVGFRDGVSWTDIEIINDHLGKPIVHLSGHLKQLADDLKTPAMIHISISHCKEYATAFAIVSG